MRRDAKVDANQREIVDALLAAGASVSSLAPVGCGVPDLLVGLAGANYLLEVKTRQGRMTKLEAAWHYDWRGQVNVVRNVEEALRVVGVLE